MPHLYLAHRPVACLDMYSQTATKLFHGIEASTGILADNMRPETISPFEQLLVSALALMSTFPRTRAPRQPPACALPAFRSVSRSHALTVYWSPCLLPHS